MSRRYFYIVFCIMCMTLPRNGVAQDVGSIKLIARAHPDSVILRWAPSSASAWKLLNSYGYRIERYIISRDGNPVNQKLAVTLATGVKPAIQNRWEASIEKDDLVAISAQSIFGEEFQVDPGQSSVMEIYNKTRELESRYSFALFAADLSPLAADLSGVRYVDKNVKATEMYLYRVYSLVPESLKKIEFGFVYTGPSAHFPLPVPSPPEIENKTENSVLIKWEISSLRDIYIAYQLERSLDNRSTFAKVSELPMSVLSSTPANNQNAYSSKSDTVIVGQTVVYRIRGINSFGEAGPPSEELVFQGKPRFDYQPAISNVAVDRNNQVKLEWENHHENISELSGYDIERGKTADGAFEKLNDQLIDKSQTRFTDPTPLSTGYYRLVAFSSDGVRNSSFPRMVQLEDSIPPLPPTGLRAIVDSLGKVTLQWNKSVETDLLGYRIFRSRFKNSEFGQVTVSPLNAELFVDTVNIRSLDTRMYYKLVAVDNRFNTSDFSQLIELELPDILPPVPPVITDVRLQKAGIRIAWRNSSSSDVKEHRIYRSSSDSIEWKLVKTILQVDTASSYTDRPWKVNKLYKYTIAAVDRSGLQSPIVNSMTGKLLPDMQRKGVENLRANANREMKNIELSWKDKKEMVQKFLVYRSKNEEPLSLYSSVTGSTNNFTDSNLDMGSVYSYRLKTLYSDGTESFFSDAVKVNY